MFRRSTIALACFSLTLSVVPGALAQVTQPLPPGSPTPDGFLYSYAVKFVCGFQKSNVGVVSPGVPVPTNNYGEPTVKAGNYATDINIFNPSPDNSIWKKVLLLVDEGFPVGREPAFVGPSGGEDIFLPTCTATMDDCNKILEMMGRPPSTGLNIGFLQIKSKEPLDVTAVYTAEMCSDMAFLGPAAGCSTLPGAPGFAGFSAGISIDVETIQGRLVRDPAGAGGAAEPDPTSP